MMSILESVFCDIDVKGLTYDRQFRPLHAVIILSCSEPHLFQKNCSHLTCGRNDLRFYFANNIILVPGQEFFHIKIRKRVCGTTQTQERTLLCLVPASRSS